MSLQLCFWRLVPLAHPPTRGQFCVVIARHRMLASRESTRYCFLRFALPQSKVAKTLWGTRPEKWVSSPHPEVPSTSQVAEENATNTRSAMLLVGSAKNLAVQASRSKVGDSFTVTADSERPKTGVYRGAVP